MDITDWLHGMALERYVETFRANAIEVGVLPDLTETDLEMLGVLLGHRKLMLRAIAALREPPQPVTDLAPGRADTAERRQLRSWLGLGLSERGDRPEHELAVTEQDTEHFEVGLGQIG